MLLNKLLLGIVFLLLLSSCVRITDMDGSELPLKITSDSIYLDAGVPQDIISKTSVLKALVKGSIYEEGEMMSVFGTCLDGADNVVPGVGAVFSAWYPNGTVYLTNFSMQQIQPGYFVYRGAMQPVEGTYLTQLECFLPSGEHALAFGEWQNPFWVKRIAKLNETLTETNNITWTMINSIDADINQTNVNMDDYYNNLTTQITMVGGIANDSVDRNDSLIMDTLRDLTGLVIHGVNNTGEETNYELDWDIPVFNRPWGIVARAYDTYNNLLSYPDVSCDIYTSISGVWNPMVPQGSYFEYEELINSRQDYQFNVSCYWN